MLTIKLTKIGKAKFPTFRLIVLEKGKDPWGAYLENLGSYNARKKVVNLNPERIKYWISKGAQLTPTAHNLLINQKIIEGAKVKKVKISAKRKTKLAEKKKATEVKAA